jgi:hypothetical protein
VVLSAESDSQGAEIPVGFLPTTVAYLLVEQKSGPDALVALDLETRKQTELLRDDDVDPAGVIYRNGTRIPVGLYFMDGKPRTAFLDEKSPEARLQRGLEAAFAGNAVQITSQTTDGGLALVKVSSDRNPGDFTCSTQAGRTCPGAPGLARPAQAQMQPVKLWRATD